MKLILKNAYDSHVHWMATGESETRLSLKDLSSPYEVQQLRLKSHHFRGEWIRGFGWDQTKWTPSQFPHRMILDTVFPENPVAFIRSDGHALWVNSQALHVAGLMKSADRLPDPAGGLIVRDAQGLPSGVLVDNAMDAINGIIPPPSPSLIKSYLLAGAATFQRAGFTHIRDMTCSKVQWEQALSLDLSKNLNLAVDQYFDISANSGFAQVLDLARRAQAEQSPHLRVQGIKCYFDGALGSEGALLSRCYHSGSCGLQLMSRPELEEVLCKTWEASLNVAVHVIGDEAAHRVAEIATALWDQGHKGQLHLEHTEVMRQDTILLLKGRNVICHLQPCHWLTDRRWIDERLGPLKQHLFPWRSLQDNQISFDFGSDCPIEPTSLANTFDALTDTARSGIPPLLGDVTQYLVHPDASWTPNTYSEFSQNRPVRVTFEGQIIWQAVDPLKNSQVTAHWD